MKMCVIGGTNFSGRAFTGMALDAGHEVTVFHRGTGADDPWPEAEHVHGDRNSGLTALSGRAFDVVVDFCGYVPRQIEEATAILPDGRYVFVSSVSAHVEHVRAGATEVDDVYPPPFPETEDVTWETYGPLKVACERALFAARGDLATVVRPHYIVGPHDPTDRFTYWVRRTAAGGRMLAPAPADQPMQWIDARDLAAFILHVGTTGIGGTFNIAVPPGRHSLGELLETSSEAAGSTIDVAWCDEAFVASNELLVTEADDPFPLITPDEPNAHLFDTSHAVANGLAFRPLEDTVNDTLAWDRDRGLPEMKIGLAAQREVELLAAWEAGPD
ncbi:MAG: NAD-dependent epimerase/dehydratase family protein [Actinomycetota bacterium]